MRHAKQTKGEPSRSLKMWLAVAGIMVVVLAIWAFQLKQSVGRIVSNPTPGRVGQELEQARAELDTILLRAALPELRAPHPTRTLIQDTALKNLSEQLNDEVTGNQ